MSLIHNERIKLRANAFDRLSTACLAVGVLGQVLSLNPAAALLSKVFSMACWILFAIALHWWAYRTLGKLEP
jgi:hypothetical protein